MREFSANDGPDIKAGGAAYRKASVTWAQPIDEDFVVQTNEGPLTAHPGDYVAFDEKSGHVWPVAKSYVEQNYEKV